MTKTLQADEKDLCLRLRKGEENAFSALYLSYANMVFRRIQRLVHIHEVAEELTQDVFYQIWNKRDKIDPDIPFSAIALRTAKSVAINFYHKTVRERNLREQLIVAGSVEYNPVEEASDYNETRKLLDIAIAKLPPQRQRVFTLCKIEGKRYEDVASELGVSVGTIKDHMAKAIRFLKQEIAVHSEKTFLYAVIMALLFE